VGRGKTVVKHHFGDDTEVLLVEHRMPLRSADEVILVNGKQFDSTDFKEFCTYLGTRLCFASVYHLQSNGAVDELTTSFLPVSKETSLSCQKANGAKS
jgi:hypothetical protein